MRTVAWNQRASGWATVFGTVALAAIVALVIVTVTDHERGPRLGGRPPAAAPQGSQVVDGEGFAIAAPSSWIVGTDPGTTFPQLRRRDWGTPLAATDGINGEGLMVVPLHHLRHDAQVDPALFWSDQVLDAGTTRSITPGPHIGVHGFRANRVTITDPSGSALVAASIDTGDRTFLVAVTAPTLARATTRFDSLIQTFDAR